jgi:uncharacterized membrane protein YeaQ/YmgE (transglycosylase-associated protein family)
MRDPILHLLLLLIIGIVAGLIFDRFAGPGWLERQVKGPRNYVTCALIGIAGAFIGYHVALLMPAASIYVGYVAAALGAFIVLFFWRPIR